MQRHLCKRAAVSFGETRILATHSMQGVSRLTILFQKKKRPPTLSLWDNLSPKVCCASNVTSKMLRMQGEFNSGLVTSPSEHTSALYSYTEPHYYRLCQETPGMPPRDPWDAFQRAHTWDGMPPRGKILVSKTHLGCLPEARFRCRRPTWYVP